MQSSAEDDRVQQHQSGTEKISAPKTDMTATVSPSLNQSAADIGKQANTMCRSILEKLWAFSIFILKFLWWCGTHPHLFIAIFVLGMGIFGKVGYDFFNGSVNDGFDKIFNEKFTEKHPVCYGRKEFKREIRQLLDRPNPVGIIFISGAKNAGKTTAIKSSLIGRDHVTYINLREKQFRSEQDLVKNLRDSFNIRTFQEFMKNLNLGFLSSVFNMYSSMGNILSIHNHEFKDLDEILFELEKILKFAYHKRGAGKIRARPVIFVDEIGNLQPMVNGDEYQKACVRKFINWIIKITKDMMLCDVVFASHDGFAMETLSLSDPLYTSSLMIPDYTEAELKDIVRNNKGLGLSDKFIPKILKDIGSAGSFVIDALKMDTQARFDRYVATLGFKERETIAEIIKYSKASWYVSPYTAWGDYSIEDFHCFMDKLVERKRRGQSPKIGLESLTSTCLGQVIKYFSNQGWLLYDPAIKQVSVRNKIFLEKYESLQDKEKEVAELKAQISDMNSACFGLDDMDTSDCDKNLLARLEDRLDEAYNRQQK